MTPDQLELNEQIIYFLGNNMYLLLVAFVILLFRDMIKNFFDGLKIFWGDGINEDDVIYLDGEKARVIRVGIWKSVFYLYNRNTKLIVQNDRLKYMKLEKSLPQNNTNNKPDKQLLCD